MFKSMACLDEATTVTSSTLRGSNGPNNSTAGQCIAVEHLLGDWDGPILNCHCMRCKEHKDNDSTRSSSTKRILKVTTGSTSGSSFTSQVVGRSGNNVHSEPKNDENSLPSTNMTESDSNRNRGNSDDIDNETIINSISSTDAVVVCVDSGIEHSINLDTHPAFGDLGLCSAGDNNNKLNVKKRSADKDYFTKPSKYVKPSEMTQIKEEPADFNLVDSFVEAIETELDEEDSIEVTNSDFLEIFDKALEDVSSMFRKLDDDPLNYVECTVCFKKIKESSMKQHFRTHAGHRPHLCDICGSKFTRRGDVLRHKRVVHTRMKPYVCKRCDKNFPEKNLLISHLQNHDKNTYYECDTCGYKFGKKEYYENHIRYIHNLEPDALSKYAKEDEAEAQLKELEEEDDSLWGTPIVPSSAIKLLHKSGDDNLSSSFGEDEEVYGSLMESLTNSKSCETAGTSKSLAALTQMPSFQIQTLYKTEGKDEDLVKKMLDVAVAQATNTLKSLASCSQFSQKWPRKTPHKGREQQQQQQKNKPVELVIRASVGGEPKRFIFQLEVETEFDLQSEAGQELVMSIVNQLCEGKGQLDGPVEVELHRPGKSLTQQ